MVTIFCPSITAQVTEMEQDLFESMHDGDKAAIVAVHVGAGNAMAQQCINRFNERLRQAYPQCDFREAWTSRKLIQQMTTNGVSYIPTPDELFSQLKKDGYTHVLIQSSNIVDGLEMQYLRYTVDASREQFKQIRLGDPLLSDASDYEQVAQATAEAYGSSKEANVLMCDGTTSTADSQYAMLDYTLRDKGFSGWFVGTANGFPSLDSLIRQLKGHKVKKVHLIPFLFTTNTQSHTALTSEWAQQLQKAGYKVTTEIHGLGDVDAIIDIFINHIRHAEKYRRYSAKEIKLITR